MQNYNKEEVIKAWHNKYPISIDYPDINTNSSETLVMIEIESRINRAKLKHQDQTNFLSTALDAAFKAGEENGVEKSLEIIKRHKFESFQGRDVLMSGNQVLSEVKKVPDLIRMSELLDVVKTIEKVVLSKALK